MTETFTPTQHSSVVGGSSAARVLGCPASVRLVQNMPEPPESPYAAEGTALHNAIEYCLYEGLPADDDGLQQALFRKEFYGMKLTSGQVEAVLKALVQFDAYWSELEAEDGEVTTYAIETQCAFPQIPDAFGTADILMVTPKRSVVLDWKFGAGVPVSAHANKQLMFYARAAAHSAPQFFWPKGMDEKHPDAPMHAVDVVVIQPRVLDEPSIYQLTFDELLDFEADLVDAVSTIDDPQPRVERGDYCRWCRAQPVCPIYETVGNQIAELFDGGREPETVEEEVIDEIHAYGAPGPSRIIDPDFLAELRLKAEIAEEWAKAVHGFIMDQAQTGMLPSGMKLVRKYGNLAYSEPDKADKMLANKGLSAAERRKVQPITPTQANALLKKKGKKPLNEKQATRPEIGYKMVGIDEPGEPVVFQISDDEAAEVAAALE